MPRLLVVQHHPCEGPGRIAPWASHRGLDIDLHDATAGPIALQAPLAGLVLLGGPASVLAPPAWLLHEIDAVRTLIARDRGLPVLGLCLGAQILSVALGGRVRRLGRPELGWTPVTVETGDEARPLEVLQWHEDAFDLPPGATPIARGAQCLQGFRSGRVAGLQFHPEWDAAAIDAMRDGFGLLPFDDGDDPLRQQHIATWFDDFLDAWMFDVAAAQSPVTRALRAS